MTNGMHPHEKGHERNPQTTDRPPEKPTERTLDAEASKRDQDPQSSK